MRKLLFSICFSVFLLFCTTLLAGASETTKTNYGMIFQDDAGLLSLDEAEHLKQQMKPVTRYGNVAFLTITENEDTAANYNISFRNDHWGNESSIIVLLDQANGMLQITDFGTLAEMIPNEMTDRIVEHAITYAIAGDYYRTAEDCFTMICSILDGTGLEEAVAIAELGYQEVQNGEEVREMTDSGYEIVIQDYAQLLTQEKVQDLIEEMRPIAEFGNVAFLSTNENEETAEAYSNRFLNKNWEEKVSCTVLLIDMDNRVIRVQSDGDIGAVVDENYGDTITDNIYSFAKNGDYYGCAQKAYSQIHALLNGQRIAQPMKYICNVLLALIFAAAIMFVVIDRMIRMEAPKTDELMQYIKRSVRISDVHMKKKPRPVTTYKSHSGGYSSHSSSSGSSSYSSSSRSSSSGYSSHSSSSYSSSSRSSSSGSSSRSSSSRSSARGGEHKF